jgi:hypothetical protein
MGLALCSLPPPPGLAFAGLETLALYHFVLDSLSLGRNVNALEEFDHQSS